MEAPQARGATGSAAAVPPPDTATAAAGGHGEVAAHRDHPPMAHPMVISQIIFLINVDCCFKSFIFSK